LGNCLGSGGLLRRDSKLLPAMIVSAAKQSSDNGYWFCKNRDSLSSSASSYAWQCRVESSLLSGYNFLMECRFCNLEEKESERILKVFTHCTVIFSNPRLMPGHLLVIPKRHLLNLCELSEEERKELFDVTITYQEKILKHVAPGCDIKQHNRPFITENDLKVDHLHIHLQPRGFEDELYLKSQIHDIQIFQKLTQVEVSELATLLQ
jgi:diadenosine tetraphosphate (Ap4A) HIT family hydrolase